MRKYGRKANARAAIALAQAADEKRLREIRAEITRAVELAVLQDVPECQREAALNRVVALTDNI